MAAGNERCVARDGGWRFRTAPWAVWLCLGTSLWCGVGCEQAVEPIAGSPEAAIEVDTEESSIDTARARSTTIQQGEAGAAAIPTAPALPAVSLSLKVGDRFPLRKVVDQVLTQPAPGGQGVSTSRSTLELLLALTVEEVRTGEAIPETDPKRGFKRLSVRYARVKFEQQLADTLIRYDSAQPPAQIPLEALGYHGLANNSFQFWMDGDNQIREMIGFEAFLDRCMAPVPPERQAQVRTLLAASSGADGVANFVDDSIGLLPGTAVREGDSWTRTRSVLQPVPMRIDSRYMLRELSQDLADIDVTGTIQPSLTFRPAETAADDVQVNIRKGHVYGKCLVDRRTGLPVEATINQDMEMRVRLAGGVEFDQSKRMTTTVSVFQSQGAGNSPEERGTEGTIQPTSGEEPASGAAPQPVPRDGLIRTSDVFPAEARSVVR